MKKPKTRGNISQIQAIKKEIDGLRYRVKKPESMAQRKRDFDRMMELHRQIDKLAKE